MVVLTYRSNGRPQRLGKRWALQAYPAGFKTDGDQRA